MFRSAVFKLTAAYTAILCGTCLVFSYVLYHFTVSELHTGFYNQYNRWFTAYQPFGLRNPGSPGQELAARSHHIFTELVYFNLLVLVLSTAGCYLLAKRTLRPIEAAHEQQKRFTADVSHELRTPLTALRMESEVSLLDPKSRAPQLRAALRSNLEEVDRMEALINNLLLLSQMEADKLRTTFVRLNGRELVSDAITAVNTSATSAGVSIISKLNDAYVRGDRRILTQLYMIVLENAIKYSPAGSSVEVSMKVGRTRNQVEVRDNGPGIPASDLPHVFDRFYRADPSRSKQSATAAPQGFGLGLSLAKLIADLHNGEIIISSAPEQGTTVTILLPRNYTT